MKKIFLLLVILGSNLLTNRLSAQALGLNNATPDPSSILDMVSTSKGLLIPRMTTVQRTGIGAPANGLIVYDIDLKTLYYYDGPAATWRSVYSSAASSSALAWGISGNAGIIDGTDFIGTTDGADLDIRTNNTERMTIDGATGYVGIGIVSPVSTFHVSSPSTTSQTTLFDQYGSEAQIILRRANGTQVAPTAIQNGETTAYLNFSGYDGAAFTTDNASIKSKATQNWNATDNGSKLEFATVPNGSTVPVTAMTIDQNQSVLIGSANQFTVAATGNVTMADGTLLDLSQINASSSTEGFKLPQATNVSTGTAEGQIQWDTDGDLLQIGTGTSVKTIGIPNNIQAFTASGNWTKPAGVNWVWVKVWGGGGGGADGEANLSGGGGGGGGYAEGLIEVSGPAGTNYVVTVGAAGGAESNGGTSSFAGTSVTIQATGGTGSTNATGGAGGVGSNGTINLTGGTGGQGNGLDGGSAGAGGGSPMGGAGGGGGAGANVSNPGIAGTAGTFPGGGGGGGSEDNSAGSGGSGDGASGAAGFVIIYY